MDRRRGLNVMKMEPDFGRLANPDEDAAADAPDVVTVSVPARREYVPGVRLLSSAVAVRQGLSVDDLEDVQMAVDEACGLLVLSARPGDRLEAQFILDPAGLRVTIAVPDSGEVAIDVHGLSWMVLSAVAEQLEVTRDERVIISFSKRARSRAVDLD